ncbi:PREDICTED: leucine-rich repeat-containing protein 29 [Elephantulus edwardii]|uniref:leucine-rich repeat-containing protein 29 n=1 Tax=Elephantulus edwardii TaxID=28737 RepID=UPI0003F09D59|nr:PREDICTED: leucine-rich repeat-containing protein 29 [Elephantulus edwardii]
MVRRKQPRRGNKGERLNSTLEEALRGGGGGRAAMAESLPPEMITYILSFLPLSDQKEASLVSRAWYHAAQNALREQPGLTSLDLSGCSELSDGALLAVSRGLRRLRHLSLRKLQRLTDVGCKALGGLRELQCLDMAECSMVSGQELASALGSACGAPPPLASLSLAYCSSLKPHPELEHPAVGPKELPIQPQGPSLLMLQTLQELDLTACSKLTDASLAKVLQFPQLRKLSLSLLPAFTDVGLVAVARGCPSLEYLALSHCSLLSDEGWAQAAGSWPRLQHLNLSSCSQLTEQTLDTIGQTCKQLRVLDVAMCPGISVTAVRRFQTQWSQVTCVQSRFVGGADLTLTL